MRDIRIGKDFKVQWSIHKFVDGERLPYELAGKELQLFISNDNGKKEVTGWKVHDNVIEWTFFGKDQRRLGAYQLVLVENAGKEGMVTVDTCKAFNLVAHSCEENVDGGNGIVIDALTLESEVALAPVVIVEVYDDSELREAIADLQEKDKATDAEIANLVPIDRWESTNMEMMNAISLNDEAIAEQSGKLAELSEEKEDKKNKVTSLSDESTDEQYPSARAVYALKERISENEVLIEDLQNTKIDRENDDYYPKMAVGLADNLAGVDVVDSEINFRRSGGGAISDGVARIESIKGNSVVWNQLAKEINATNWGVYNSTFASQTFSNGEINVAVQDITLTGYRVGITLKASQSLVIGHIYLAIGEIKCAVPCRFTIEVKKSSVAFGEVATTWTPLSAFVTSDHASTKCIISPQGTFTESANTYSVRGVRLFDLTQMFGAGNEPTTIEEFYARIPMGVDLNAYNEGEVIHMDVQSVESQGVNAWDEEWELGSIDFRTGALIESTAKIRSKNFNEIIGGKSYALYCPSLVDTNTTLVLYDKDYQVVDYWGFYQNGTRIVKIPQKGRYFKLAMYTTYGTTYKGDICINLSDTSINGKYFPYIKRVEELSIIRKYFPQGMKSAGTAHDEIRYNKASGKWVAKDALLAVKMKDLDWRGSTAANYTHAFRAVLNVGQASGNNVMCRSFVRLSDSPITAWITDNNPYTIAYYNGYIGVNDPAYTDVNAFIASLTDDDVLYIERAEPIVMELDEADQFKDLDYPVWNAGTEKTIAEGRSAPLAADITYGFNAIGKIKELESLVAALRAKVGI